MATVKADVQIQLEQKYTKVTVSWEGTSGTKLNFSLSVPKKAQAGTFSALGYTAENDPIDDVKAALAAADKKGDFPTGETWTVTRTFSDPSAIGQGRSVTNGDTSD